MNNLIVCRHGEYGSDGKLTPDGKARTTVLGQKLLPYLNGMSIRILTSTASRAVESATILKAFWGTRVHGMEAHEILYPKNSDPADLDGTLALVRKHAQSVGAIVLVTHHQHARSFPVYFAKNELARTPSVRPHAIDLSEAWVLACDTAELTHVFP